METKQVRMDLEGNHPHVVDSVISVIDYDEGGNIKRQSVIESPLGRAKDIETTNLKERLEELLYRCFNFTSKFCGVDEFTGERYPEEDLRLYTIRGAKTYNSHFCAGDILYHPNNKYLKKWIELMFWEKYNVIPSSNLSGKEIKVLRTSGNIEDGKIGEYEGLIYIKKMDQYGVKVYVEDGLKEKYVPLSKILDYNPELNITINIPHREIYDECPSWLLETYDNWINKISEYPFTINYEMEYNE